MAGRLDYFVLLTRASVALALCVIVLGAYVRLSDAGLGCPDWPGCYGEMLVPQEAVAVTKANEAYPERPLETGKAWKEMIHRYLAGLLGLCILGLAVLALKQRHQPGQPLRLPLFILGLVIFQALLGMWTVTLLLKPLVVVAHLLGGMTILLLLWWMLLGLPARPPAPSPRHPLWPWAGLALLVLYAQIFLGGWTSANYAALVCVDLPTCQGQWLPPMDFQEGFTLWRGLGQDYEGGVLDAAARTAIHVTHRVGAVITIIVLIGVAIAAMRAGSATMRRAALAIIGLVLAQASLGVVNILHVLPLPVAVAHNGVAALLLISVGTLLYHAFCSQPPE